MFLALRDLMRSSKKVFIEGSLVSSPTAEYIMEWLRDKEMLLRLIAVRYFLKRKEQESVVFVKEEFLLSKIQKKENVFGYLTTN